MLKSYLFSILFLLLTVSPAQAVVELRVLASGRITPPDLVDRFENESGIRVRFEYFNSPEDLASYLDARPDGDMALIRGFYLKPIISRGTLAPLDHQQLPNLKNLKQAVFNNPEDPSLSCSLPVIQGTIGFLYRAGLWGDLEPGWRNIFSPHGVVTSFGLPDLYRDAMGAALVHLGYSVNSTSPVAISQAAELLRSLTSHPAFIDFMNAETTLRFIKERFIGAAVISNDSAAKAMAEDPGLSFHVPDQGGLIWSYVYIINNKSTKKEAAHQWLNFLLEPEVAARISIWNMAAVPNQAAWALLPPEIINNVVIYPPAEVWSRSELIMDVGLADQIYRDYWSQLR